MPVDPTQPRELLVIHGVQAGEDADLHQDRAIRELVSVRLGDIPLRFTTSLFRYEDVNDAAQRAVSLLVGLLVKDLLARRVARQALDLVGDVVIALRAGSTAGAIRQGLRERILTLYAAGTPCYLVAHSLGSIYAFDVLNELIRDPAYFDRVSRRTWPVQGLVTLGSPIGLEMFRVRGRRRVANLGEGTKWLRWFNYFDRTDPVVSGHLFGQQLAGFQVAECYQGRSPRQGWVIRDRPVDTGRAHLLAHVAYWGHPVVGDGLVEMITH